MLSTLQINRQAEALVSQGAQHYTGDCTSVCVQKMSMQDRVRWSDCSFSECRKAPLPQKPSNCNTQCVKYDHWSHPWAEGESQCQEQESSQANAVPRFRFQTCSRLQNRKPTLPGGRRSSSFCLCPLHSLCILTIPLLQYIFWAKLMGKSNL